jgi:hypothetical protein
VPHGMLHAGGPCNSLPLHIHLHPHSSPQVRTNNGRQVQHIRNVAGFEVQCYLLLALSAVFKSAYMSPQAVDKRGAKQYVLSSLSRQQQGYNVVPSGHGHELADRPPLPSWETLNRDLGACSNTITS